VLAGVSYSVAREWFRLPQFPVLLGKTFWRDFVEWRKMQNGGRMPANNDHPPTASTSSSDFKRSIIGLPTRAAQILRDSAK